MQWRHSHGVWHCISSLWSKGPTINGCTWNRARHQHFLLFLRKRMGVREMHNGFHYIFTIPANCIFISALEVDWEAAAAWLPVSCTATGAVACFCEVHLAAERWCIYNWPKWYKVSQVRATPRCSSSCVQATQRDIPVSSYMHADNVTQLANWQISDCEVIIMFTIRLQQVSTSKQ